MPKKKPSKGSVSIKFNKSCRTIAPSRHKISRNNISLNAIKVIQQLNDKGFEAYLVGGGVRDLLLGKIPKDFDVATDATPEQVRGVFRRSRIVGRRFRIVHVHYGREIIEVTTFRGEHEQRRQQSIHQLQSQSGQLLRDNVYGDIESDALRRDFTVNALYYSLKGGAVYDYASGLDDIKSQQLRLIGSPETRYREDPVRLLRAIRFAAKLGFTIEKETAVPIAEQSRLLINVSNARLFDEVLKLFLGGYAVATFELLCQYRLFEQLFPATAEVIDKNSLYLAMIEAVMFNTDKRIHGNKRVTPAFIFAALLWPPMMQCRYQLMQEERMSPMPAFTQAARTIIDKQLVRVAIPKRFLATLWQIWELQWTLPKRHGKRAEQLVGHPRFRAAYDFLLMREAAGEDLDNLGDWWTRYQDGDNEERKDMVASLKL